MEDLRFPELFRALVDKGADMICIPSAFSFGTGKVHWKVWKRERILVLVSLFCFCFSDASGSESDRESSLHDCSKHGGRGSKQVQHLRALDGGGRLGKRLHIFFFFFHLPKISPFLKIFTKILCEGEESKEEIVYCEIDFSLQMKKRAELPSLKHRRKDIFSN